MSGIRRLITALCVALAVCAVLPSASAAANVPVERIQLSRGNKLLAEKGKWFISSAVYPSQATNKALEWTVDNESVAVIASVTPQGAWIQAKGKSGDEACVTAKAADGGGVTANCLLRITAPVSDILLWSDSDDGKILVNESLRIYASVLPSDASDELDWSVSDKNVASIAQTYPDGVVLTACGGGEAIVTAQSQDGTLFSKSYSVNVRVPIESMALPEKRDMFIGDSFKFEPKFAPPNTTDTTVRWRSENEKIAYVNSAGLVTAIGEGSTRIFAKSAANAEVNGVCQIRVTRPVLIINLTTAYPVIGVGGKTQVVASIAPYNATVKNIVWSINDESVASVNTSGVVTGVKPGVAIVSATALDGSGAAGLLPIEVRGGVESISLPSQASLYPGESRKLTPTVTPHDLVIEGLKWTSSDESVASVSNEGTVTGVSVGKATVTATSPGGITAACAVTVSEAITDIKIFERDKEIFSSSVFGMYKGEEAAFRANIRPASGEYYINWSSSKRNVARITDNGAVRAVAPGASRITASAVDNATGIVKASKSFIVRVRVPVTSVVMPGHINLLTGSSRKITATVKPGGASDKSLTWASSDESVAKVSNGVVTGCSAGEALILATSKNLVIGVTSVSVANPVASISISLPEGVSRVWAGDSFRLDKTVSPAEASGDVVWKSSNKSVATVSSDGTVVARRSGSALITASATDGSGVKASIKLTVEDTVIGVSFKHAVLELFSNSSEEKFKSFTLKPVIRPPSAAKREISWTSSDPGIAVVSENGKVSAVSEGTCAVTAEVEGVKASVVVKVMSLPSFINLNIGEMSLIVGDKVSVATDVKFDGSDTYLVWKSSRKRVASINDNGLIKARKPGVTIISAKTRNGLKASFKLTVTK